MKSTPSNSLTRTPTVQKSKLAKIKNARHDLTKILTFATWLSRHIGVTSTMQVLTSLFPELAQNSKLARLLVSHTTCGRNFLQRHELNGSRDKTTLSSKILHEIGLDENVHLHLDQRIFHLVVDIQVVFDLAFVVDHMKSLVDGLVLFGQTGYFSVPVDRQLCRGLFEDNAIILAKVPEMSRQRKKSDIRHTDSLLATETTIQPKTTPYFTGHSHINQLHGHKVEHVDRDEDDFDVLSKKQLDVMKKFKVDPGIPIDEGEEIKQERESESQDRGGLKDPILK